MSGTNIGNITTSISNVKKLRLRRTQSLVGLTLSLTDSKEHATNYYASLPCIGKQAEEFPKGGISQCQMFQRLSRVKMKIYVL